MFFGFVIDSTFLIIEHSLSVERLKSSSENNCRIPLESFRYAFILKNRLLDNS